MAEVVGIVAAGVAFAEVIAKLGAQAFTLKRMYNDIKEIPDSIKGLFEQIELLSLLLQEMEADLSSPNLTAMTWGSGVDTLIITSCRSTIDALTASTEELAQEIISKKRLRRAMAKGKLVLDRDFWVGYEKGLQRVVWMLALAQQKFHM